ncbi:hypothetical protein [uncultured Marivita sp.]|jgi:hypothetical protein|uniref:hypothetical protein n=2 Tax=unclassified Marivita TaxID=2632480 RepID=UPI000D7A890F|nr:hypothetical protein [uncultured Marivita sp.]PWL34624.1 MAG: hypothetical protein DCO97_13625 [Marivita sp. XM-24bin2]
MERRDASSHRVPSTKGNAAESRFPRLKIVAFAPYIESRGRKTRQEDDMNLNQIINMVMRTVMRRVVNSGIKAGMNAGQNALAKRKKAAPQREHDPRV